jgi:hypothetical protein
VHNRTVLSLYFQHRNTALRPLHRGRLALIEENVSAWFRKIVQKSTAPHECLLQNVETKIGIIGSVKIEAALGRHIEEGRGRIEQLIGPRGENV